MGGRFLAGWLLVVAACGDDSSDVADSMVDSRVDSSRDAAVDGAPGDGAPRDAPADSSIDGPSMDADGCRPVGDIVGSGMTCDVIAGYQPSDIGSRAGTRWLAAGDRIVRVDARFSNPTVEHIVDGEVLELLVTDDHALAVLESATDGSRSVVIRDPTGTWSPSALPGSPPLMRFRAVGTSDAFLVDDVLNQVYRYDGSWSAIAPPTADVDITGAEAWEGELFAPFEDALHVHDGTSWTRFPADALLAMPPGGPPIEMPNRVLLADIAIASATDIAVVYILFRGNRELRTSVAKFDGLAFSTWAAPAPPGPSLDRAGARWVFGRGTHVLNAMEDEWVEVAIPLSFGRLTSHLRPGRRDAFRILDGAGLWASSDRNGIYRLDATTWTRVVTPTMPERLLGDPPDTRVAPAEAYGSVFDYDDRESQLVRWTDAGFEPTPLRGPPSPQATWVGPVAYYLLWVDDTAANAYRWEAGVSARLPPAPTQPSWPVEQFVGRDQIHAHADGVFAESRIGTRTWRVFRLDGTAWTSAAPILECLGTSSRLVTAGAGGLVRVQCETDIDPRSAYVLDGGWTRLMDLHHLGHFGGLNGIAVFGAPDGTFPTYDGVAWDRIDPTMLSSDPSWSRGRVFPPLSLPVTVRSLGCPAGRRRARVTHALRTR
ncbi:MAG: hypothetical protein AAGF12_11810 [Myxococcota bacterium]